MSQTNSSVNVDNSQVFNSMVFANLPIIDYFLFNIDGNLTNSGNEVVCSNNTDEFTSSLLNTVVDMIVNYT